MILPTDADISALLLQEDRVIIGSHQGTLIVFRRDAPQEVGTSGDSEVSCWVESHTLTVTAGVAVDNIQALHGESLMACCAGNITMYSITRLGRMAAEHVQSVAQTPKATPRFASARSPLRPESGELLDNVVCTHCTGAFCVQTSGAASVVRRGFRSGYALERALRPHQLCVAQHARLRLLEVARPGVAPHSS